MYDKPHPDVCSDCGDYKACCECATSRLRVELASLQADHLAVCQALGMTYEAEGHNSAPAPVDDVLRVVRELKWNAGRESEAAERTHCPDCNHDVEWVYRRGRRQCRRCGWYDVLPEVAARIAPDHIRLGKRCPACQNFDLEISLRSDGGIECQNCGARYVIAPMEAF